MDSEKALRQAIAAIKAGDQETGQQLLAQVISADPQNEAAWSLLASVLEDEDKKRRCLERVLAINPGNGRAALELLQLQEAKPSVKPRQGESSKLVESVQCPKCGAPVDVTAGRESLHCTYCGAGLKITRGASGHAMATLDDIKADTSVLAIRAALERLDERVSQARDRLGQLHEARRGTTYLVVILEGLVLALVVVLSAVLSSVRPLQAGYAVLGGALALILFATVIAVAFLPFRKLRSRIRSTERKIADLERQREEVRSRLDALTEHM